MTGGDTEVSNCKPFARLQEKADRRLFAARRMRALLWEASVPKLCYTRPQTRHSSSMRAWYSLLLIVFALAPAAARDVELVRAQTRLAAGGSALEQLKAIRITYRLRQAGLTGTGTTLTDVVSGKTVTRQRLGPLSRADGYDGTNYWEQDWADIVTIPKGGLRPAQSVSAHFRDALAFWYPGRAGPAQVTFRFQLFRQRVKEVFAIAPKGGLPFEVWFDAQTKLLDRFIEDDASETRITTYEDYRPVGGLMIAHRIRSSNAAAAFGSERIVTKVELSPQLIGTEFAVPPAPKPDYTFQRASPVTTLPFRLINNHIYADVALNGQVFAMLIDTGASNVITPFVARKLGLAPIGDAIVKGAGELSVQAQFTTVKSVALADVRLRNQIFAVVKLEHLREVEGVPFHGILGYELFKRFVVRIDYPALKLTLIRPEGWRPEGSGLAVPFVFNATVPEVQGEISGIPASFEVDTGSRTSISLNSPFVQLHALRARFRPSVEAVTGWGLGGPARGTVARIRNVRLGPITVNDIVIDMSRQTSGVLSHTVPSGSIGGGLLKRFVTTFDYAGQKFYLLAQPGGAMQENFDRSGLWINQTSAGFRVEDIIAGSPAAAVGLRTGDVIVRVDGKPASSISLHDMREQLRNPAPGAKIRLKIQSVTSIREVVLELKHLI